MPTAKRQPNAARDAGQFATTITPDKVRGFRLLALKGALKLESKGMKRSRGPSALSIVRSLGIKAKNAKEALPKFLDYLAQQGIETAEAVDAKAPAPVEDSHGTLSEASDLPAPAPAPIMTCRRDPADHPRLVTFGNVVGAGEVKVWMAYHEDGRNLSELAAALDHRIIPQVVSAFLLMPVAVAETKRNAARVENAYAAATRHGYHSPAEFVDYLRHRLIPDLRASGHGSTATDLTAAAEIISAAL